MALNKSKLGASLGNFSEQIDASSKKKTSPLESNGLASMINSSSEVLGDAQGDMKIRQQITKLRKEQAGYNYVVNVPPRRRAKDIKQTRRLSFDITEYLYCEWQIFALERELDGDKANFSEFVRQAMYNEFSRLKKNKNLQEWRKKNGGKK